LSAHGDEDRPEPGSIRTLVDYGITFAPWAGYIVFTHVFGSWKYGFLVGLALSVAIVAGRTLQHDSRFLDLGTLVYCAAMTAVSTTHPSSPIRAYNLPLSLGAVGTLSSASLAMRSPFTYRIARDHVPKELLDSPIHRRLLYRAHIVATSCWAGSQLVAGGVSAAMVAAKTGSAAVIAVQSVGTLVPVAATRFQHERVAQQFHTAEARRSTDKPTAPSPAPVLTTAEAGGAGRTAGGAGRTAGAKPAGTEELPRPAEPEA
jgi:hypothetical protein